MPGKTSGFRCRCDLLETSNVRIALVPVIALLVMATLLPPAASAQKHVLHEFDKIDLTDKFYAEGANFGDFNRDGTMDVVAGPYWYEGPTFETAHAYYPVKAFDPHKYSDNFFAYAYDFNEDGWWDILIIGFPGMDASWYENPKESVGDWTRHVVVDVVDNEAAMFVDITGDGRPEVVGGQEGRYGYAEPDWSNPAEPWAFHPITEKGPWERFTHRLGVGDVNGDNRPDLIDQGGWWEQPSSLDGDAPWARHEVDFGQGGAQMYAYDIDGDGDNDVITTLTAHEYGLAWFEQMSNGEGREFKRHVIMGESPEENKYGVSFTQMHALELVDLNGDGLKDLITGKRYWAHGTFADSERDAPAVLYWFETVRGKDGVHFIPRQIDDDSGVGVQLITVDANEDGWPDVVSSNKKGARVFLNKPRSVSASEWKAAQPVPRSSSVHDIHDE